MNLSGSIFDYVIVFWAGVVVSFTPCVYPVMPLTAGLIAGANVKGSRLTGFLLSLVYVLGLAVSYCALAVIAVLSGKVFGQIQNTPIVYAAIGVLMVLFGLMMMDWLHIPHIGFQIRQNRPETMEAVFLCGLTSGLIVGPCTAPVLATLLTYVASKQNLWYGISLLFVFSYGVGASLILVGTFSGLLSQLPKSGKWLQAVKKLSGVLIIAVGCYFLVKAWHAWSVT